MRAGDRRVRACCEFVAGMLEGMQPRLEFPNHAELTPEILTTRVEESDVFHTTEKCTDGRFRGTAGAGEAGGGRRLCFSCEDILRAKRSG